MATRLYFPLTTAAYVTPAAPGAEWEHNQGTTRALQRNTADASTLTTSAYTPDAADDLTNKDAMHRQYVSPQLAAQTFSGNVTAQIQGLEAHANNNLFLTMVVKVISSDGATVRATLLAITRAPGAEFTAALRNTTFDSVALTGYTCIAGDRLLVEVGTGGTAGPATGGVQGHNSSLRWGTNASGGDLAINDETEAGTTFRPWVEFSTTVLWNDLAPTPGTLSLALTAFAPVVTTTAHVTVTPGTRALVTNTFAPVVTASNHQVVTPGTVSLVLALFAPTVTVGGGDIVVTPDTLPVTLSLFTPVVTATNHIVVTPGTLALSLTAFAPSVTATNNILVTPGTLALALSGLVPTVTAGGGIMQWASAKSMRFLG